MQNITEKGHQKIQGLSQCRISLAKSAALPKANFTVSGASWMNCG